MHRYLRHLRATSGLAVPLIGGNLAQQAIAVTDTVMVGWYGVEALAAVTLAATIYFIVYIVGSGFAMAVMPLVATAAAKADSLQVRRITRMGLWIGALSGLVAYPLFWFAGPVLQALGQSEELAQTAQTYSRIAGSAMAVSIMIMVLRSHLSALERTGMVLWATLGGAMLNVGLNWVFIFGNLGAPEMGVAGAAIASVGTNIGIFLVLGFYAARAAGLAEYALFQRLWRIDPWAFGQVFHLGWPIGLTQLAETGLFTASTMMMGWIGTAELAAHGVAIQIASIMFTMQVAVSSAATVRAGQAYGRANAQGLRDGAVAALALSLLLVGVTITLFLVVPELLVGLFIAPDEPQRAVILLIGTGLLAVGALFQLADAAQVMALGLLRGLQDTKVPMIHAVISYWGVGLPASYLCGFTFGLGGQGIWLGLAIGLGVAAVLMMTRFWRKAGAEIPA